MKKKLNNKKILVIIIIGIILSGITYVAAQTLIDSKDVIYTDTYDLGAENVQAAIDGTCSNIDKRLSVIEDKLYTITEISDRKPITTSTNFVYTGVSILLPAKSYCSIIVRQAHSGGRPYTLALNNSATNAKDTFTETSYSNTIAAAGHLDVTLSQYNESAKTYYVWASAINTGATNYIEWYGFCATKYK